MNLAPNPQVFHEYEYEVEDGPDIQGRLDATMPNSLSEQRLRVFREGQEITGDDIEARVTSVTFRAWPAGAEQEPYVDVFVNGTRLVPAQKLVKGDDGSHVWCPDPEGRKLLDSERGRLLVHHLDINRELRAQFLALHPEYKS
jgi:hypothetical protein